MKTYADIISQNNLDDRGQRRLHRNDLVACALTLVVALASTAMIVHLISLVMHGLTSIVTIVSYAAFGALAPTAWSILISIWKSKGPWQTREARWTALSLSRIEY